VLYYRINSRDHYSLKTVLRSNTVVRSTAGCSWKPANDDQASFVTPTHMNPLRWLLTMWCFHQCNLCECICYVTLRFG